MPEPTVALRVHFGDGYTAPDRQGIPPALPQHGARHMYSACTAGSPQIILGTKTTSALWGTENGLATTRRVPQPLVASCSAQALQWSFGVASRGLIS